jgi:hypothetical protein
VARAASADGAVLYGVDGFDSHKEQAMRSISKKPPTTACLGLALVLGACAATEETEETEEWEQQDVAVMQSALIEFIPPPEDDSLTAYAAKCDAATGIHVPSFSCTQGLQGSLDPNGPNEDNFTFIPQGSSVDNIEHDADIGSSGGGRTQPVGQVPPDTVQLITAGGSGIEDEDDEFYFSYVDFFGAGKAEVLVADLDDTSSSTKAGLMIRSNTASDASNVLLAVTPGGGIALQTRAIASGTTTTEATLVGQSLPIWLRFTWTSSGIVAQVSSNHESWTEVGSAVPVPADMSLGDAKVGLAVTSATADFDDFMTTKKCDKPNILSGVCDPGATFQVLARTADAIAVANCRKLGQTADEMFDDIAVIQYNRKNGALCFYQSPVNVDGSDVSAPSEGTGAGKFPWDPPDTTHQTGCTGCHDNGGLIRSPYLSQTGLLPRPNEGYDNDGSNPLSYVGVDFAEDRSWFVHSDVTNGCSVCHKLGMSNVLTEKVGWAGSAYRFSIMATSEGQTFSGEISHKNAISETSPTWMPYPGSTTFNPGALTVASYYSSCADQARSGLDAQFQVLPPVAGCDFEPFGLPYVPQIDNLNEFTVGTSGGGAIGNLQAVTLTSPPGTDVAGTSDSFYWLYNVHGGDGAAVVEVTALQNTHEWAKAGIMFRNGNAANQENVALAITPSHGVTFQHRSAVDGQTTNSEVEGVPLPVWLKLERSGRTFLGSFSTDERHSWTQVGQPVTIESFETDYLGLFASSHTAQGSGVSGQATFESFDWTAASGWTRPSNPHILMDADIGNADTERKEWITRETISSSGGDIYGTSDNFSFSLKTFGGDGHLETTVTSLTAAGGGQPHQFAKAGLMMRDDAAANAANVFVGKIRDGITFQYRNAQGNTTTVWNDETVADDSISFRLRRVRQQNDDDLFTASYKSDSTPDWTLIPTSVTLSNFTNSPLSGLAVSSHEANLVASATFESGERVEPPGLIWTSYEQPAENHWRSGDIGAAPQTILPNLQRLAAIDIQTITAAGGPIFGTSDQFFSSFQDLPGPVTIQAKVTLLGDAYTNPLAKAGLMIRNSDSPGSPNVMMAITKGQGAAFQYRSTQGGTTSFPGFTGGAVPIWLKLVRDLNNVFKGYTSNNGVDWTLVSSAAVNNIGETARVGLAVTSRDLTTPVAVEFTDISVTLQAPPAQNPCASFCQNPTSFSFGGAYQSGNLGTGAVCRETTMSIAGGNCGSLVGGRALYVNGVQMTCNYQNWPSVPAPANGGYCVQVTPGNYSWAYFTVFE